MSVRGYLLLLGALVGVLVLVEASRPRPLDLTVRLDPRGADPFDAEVFFEALPDWLGQPVEAVPEAPFDRLSDTTLTGLTYLFLAPDFVPDSATAERLLRFVARGNAAVVAAHDVRGPFGDSLRSPRLGGRAPGLRTEFVVRDDAVPFLFPGELRPDSLRLLPPGVDRDYGLPVSAAGWRIVGADSARAEVLGVAPDPDGSGRPVDTFVRVRHGRGEVLVLSTPLVFSNAALTGDGDGPAYVAAALAAFPDQPVLWDASARSGGAAGGGSPLSFALRSPPLRWSLLLLALAGALYAAFRGRRWQRAVPVVAPPPNAQREFARVLGRLHFVHRDEARLARRMVRVARDRMRTELRLDAAAFTPEAARLAAARAGVPEDEARALFATLARVERERRPDPDTLVRLDARLARFFRHTA